MDKLLEQLQRDSHLSEDQVRVVITESAISKLPTRNVLLQAGFVDSALLDHYQNSEAVLLLCAERFVPDNQALSLVSESLARRFNLLPISFHTETKFLLVAMADPSNVLARDRLQRELPGSIQVDYRRANVSEIQQSLDKCFGGSYSLLGALRELDQPVKAAKVQSEPEHTPVIRLIDAILQEALIRRASDIHLSPESIHVQIRYRIDGVLQIACHLHMKHWAAMLVRIKVLSDMDIAETRLPQDGHLLRVIHGQHIDFRVASFPLRHGENIVIRVLDKRRGLLKLAALSADTRTHSALRSMVSRPSGLVVVCGPTGSGKTTTLYALLHSLDAQSLNIMTLEDPVEYPMVNIRQTRVRGDGAFGFAEGVRAVLRQDPDVILVGEVRDPDSCGMTCRAALTGHRVLTSTHADNCINAITRLIDLGADPGMLASVLCGVISQRLIRRICAHCQQQDADCNACGGSGYAHRLALFEILDVSPTFSALLQRGEATQALHEQALADGMTPLRELAEIHLQRGHTTQAELQRVFGTVNRPGGT